MKSYITLLLFFIIGLTQAQQTPPHSLSIGLKNGAATVTYFEINTAQIGVAMDHQRNFSSAFSLRTAFHFGYFLPVKLVEYVNNQDNPEQSVEVDQHSFTQLSLRLMPCFYHRDENFNLFLGLAGGVGYYFSTMQNFDGYYDSPSNTYDLEADGMRKDNNFQVGFSPVIGAGFKLGPKGEGGEIEVSLSYESWYSHVRDWEFSNTSGGYRGFSLITAYRYNFNR
jgi:hypothetical protein